jgi:hypothetical protein
MYVMVFLGGAPLDEQFTVRLKNEDGMEVPEAVNPDQVSVFYQSIGEALAKDDRTLPLVTLVFKTKGEKQRRYPLGPEEAFTLYQTLGKFLQKHYPSSVPRFQFLEANS